jgi:hypothetical protein
MSLLVSYLSFFTAAGKESASETFWLSKSRRYWSTASVSTAIRGMKRSSFCHEVVNDSDTEIHPILLCGMLHI